jgi:two-component system chemotaxis response regulator CheB
MTNSVGHFRILLVDDSPVVRRVLTDVISSDPQLEVAGTASNGRIALERIEQLKPSLVVLDIEMPEMDGLATLTELRKKHRRLPVIMFSTLTHRGAMATLDALALGADDYVPKERNTLGLAAAIEDLRRDLLPRIHALCMRDISSGHRSRPATTPPHAVLPKLPERKIEIIALGVSTGGPDALCKLIPAIPHDLPVPVVLVQHMPALFTKLLAERLSMKSAIPVKEAAGGEPLAPGTIWLAPGGKHLRLALHGNAIFLQTDDSAPRNYCRPSVDVLLESVTEIYGASTLAVILTGMGSDGLHGCELVRKNGGQIIVQDEASSVVWGMPGAVARSGLADSVLPLSQIIDAAVQRVMKFRTSIKSWNVGQVPMRGGYVQQGE